MKKITARGTSLGDLTIEERKQFLRWAWDARNYASFDTGIFGYPRVVMLHAESDRKLAYLPVQTVLMAEAFIPDPESTNKEKAVSLGKFDEILLSLARQTFMGDVYMYSPWHEQEDEQAWLDRLMAHGWEEIPHVRLFKKRSGVQVQGIPEPSSEDPRE